METIEINGIKHDVMEANGVRYYQDWERSEGGIYVVEPKTLDRYREIKHEQPDENLYGIFFAFDKEQFEKGYKALIRKGYIKEGDKVCGAGVGLYGTREEIERFNNFYNERSKKIKKECNPQEVYFAEWNNHECMFVDDDAAVKFIVEYFGPEVAHTIRRVYEGTPINILAPLTERDRHLGQYEHELLMLSRLKSDMRGFFSKDDCRYRRPHDLWGGCIKREMQEMRDLYRKLPDDIKDASCMTKEEIEDYCKQLEAWADEEFAKPEYNPVARTPRENFPQEIQLDEMLYYQDDNGNLQQPKTVWFSSDTRRWHSDARKTHGRAMTSYLGKKGTTLAPVFYLDADMGFSRRDYIRKDLCEVECDVVKKPGRYPKLCNFRYE